MARRRGIIREIESRNASFAVAFLFLFAVTFGFLALVGATPDMPSSTGDSQDSVTQSTAQTVIAEHTQSPQEPLRVVAKKAGVDIQVMNPTTTDVEALDKELEKGAVHYPTSAQLGVNGTVLLFGHSSYLPIVYHQYYKEFNGIQNLKSGDVVSVYSSDTEYRYSVTGVRVADSGDANESVIELPNDAQHLTLVTCDSFATKSNRFVVTADFVGAYPLSQ